MPRCWTPSCRPRPGGSEWAILIPGVIDHDLVKPAGRARLGRLLQAGVEIYEYRAARFHAKTMTIDGRWSTIGGANFDNRAFALNEEVNVVVYNREVAGELERIFDAALAYSKPVTFREWRRRGLMQRLFEVLAIPFHDVLKPGPWFA
jgi:cardiolipin synthase